MPIRSIPEPGPAPVATENNPAEMTKALTTATGAKQAELLKQYAESKGPSYTQALVDAIPQLSGEAKAAAREALTTRMARSSRDHAAQLLAGRQSRVAPGHAYGIAMREEKELIPDLIAVLADKEDFVVKAVRVALRSLSNQDFGPAPGAGKAQKKEAMAGWTGWWKKQMK